jgi:hypothetical protein
MHDRCKVLHSKSKSGDLQLRAGSLKQMPEVVFIEHKNRSEKAKFLTEDDYHVLSLLSTSNAAP